MTGSHKAAPSQTTGLASVSSGVTGRITKVSVVPGQVVKPGDSLFQLAFDQEGSPTTTKASGAPQDWMAPTVAAKAASLRSQIRQEQTNSTGQPSLDFIQSATAAYLLSLDVISHNLAHVNTIGFKRSRVAFERFGDFAKNKSSLNGRVSLEVNQTVLEQHHLNEPTVCKVFTTGPLTQTGEKFDIAIQGEGFFELELPDGNRAYTRDGALRTDANGRVATLNGFPVLGGWPQLPSGTFSLGIAPTGEATISGPTGIHAFRIQLVRFSNPSGLETCGHNLFRETTASGPPELGNPGDNGLGILYQGFLELSNVDLATELMELIRVEQSYETLLRVVDARRRVVPVAGFSAAEPSSEPLALAPSAH